MLKIKNPAGQRQAGRGKSNAAYLSFEADCLADCLAAFFAAFFSALVAALVEAGQEALLAEQQAGLLAGQAALFAEAQHAGLAAVVSLVSSPTACNAGRTVKDATIIVRISFFM